MDIFATPSFTFTFIICLLSLPPVDMLPSLSAGLQTSLAGVEQDLTPPHPSSPQPHPSRRLYGLIRKHLTAAASQRECGDRRRWRNHEQLCVFFWIRTQTLTWRLWLNLLLLSGLQLRKPQADILMPAEHPSSPLLQLNTWSWFLYFSRRSFETGRSFKKKCFFKRVNLWKMADRGHMTAAEVTWPERCLLWTLRGRVVTGALPFTWCSALKERTWYRFTLHTVCVCLFS